MIGHGAMVARRPPRILSGVASDPAAAPRLSVIIPAWNAGATLRGALASVLDQRDVPLECIVVDDASTDNTATVATALARDDSRLVVIRSPANEGASGARNRALEAVRGEWIGFLDADDRLLPGGLAAMLHAADANEALAVVGQRISTDGERTWFPVLYEQPDIRQPGVKSVVRNPGLLYYAGPAGKLFHRSCTAGLRFEGRLLGDQPWVVRAMLRAGDRIAVIEDVVYEWRRPHPDRWVATLTSSREQSAALATEAVTMAGRAYDIVAAEIERIVDAPDRGQLDNAYFERLLRADLTTQLVHAVRRGDADIGGLFDALAGLVAHVPRDVAAGSDALVTRILEPPLRGWGRLPPAGRRAYWRLARTARAADPAITARADVLPARLVLRAGTSLPGPLRRPAAELLLVGWSVTRALRAALQAAVRGGATRYHERR